MKGKIVGDRYYIDGREVGKAEFDAAFPDVPPGDGPAGASLVGWKPLASDALCVHPEQVAEARESALRHGVPTDFTPEGQPILTSRTHRAAYLKAYGFYDRDAGYGDPSRGGTDASRG